LPTVNAQDSATNKYKLFGVKDHGWDCSNY